MVDIDFSIGAHDLSLWGRLSSLPETKWLAVFQGWMKKS
jgi:hypothetical protein